MIRSEDILTIIPARGGSKGVPRKNIRELGVKPLIAYTIEAAIGSSFIDRFIVSTDDEEVAEEELSDESVTPDYIDYNNISKIFP